MSKVKLDGAGTPLIPDGRYYVQDCRSVVGNCAMFWGPNRAGYVCSLDEAGVYSGDEASRMRDTDVAWPVETIEAIAVRHARSDQMPWAPGRWPTVQTNRVTAAKAERCDLCGKCPTRPRWSAPSSTARSGSTTSATRSPPTGS